MRRNALAASVLVAVAGATSAATLRLETRWPGVHLVTYDELKLKSVVAEFDTFLAVIEVPESDATARMLLAFLRERFPEKPLRFAFHTHHHGHSIGALDPLLATGVTVVTTPWNLEQIRGLAADPTTLAANVVTFRDRFTLEDGGNALRARVVRKPEYEVPSDEYVIVELPGPKALVSGCLFNKPLTYWEVINTRKTSLDRYLKASQLDVDWFVPTNTTTAGGFESVCSRAMLAETLEKGMNPETIADQLQARPVEALQADMDALVKAFGARTPRSYDLLVCGNYLKTKRQDAARAAVLFEVAHRLHPDEVDPLWFMGEAWALAGDAAKARDAWTRALERDTKGEYRERIEAGLAKL